MTWMHLREELRAWSARLRTTDSIVPNVLMNNIAREMDDTANEIDQEHREPMNLRIFVQGGVWFLRGMGYSGNGSTPEDAIREWVRHRNTDEESKWPVRLLQ